jgi:hypothetical protein
VAFPICFHYGRIKFTSPDVESGKINSVSSPPTGSLFAYLGKDVGRFIKVFAQVGAVVRQVAP